jgi:hypothetical protein
MADYRKSQVGTDWSTRSDTTTHSFRVQKDKGLDGKSDPFFTREKWLTPRTAADGSKATGIDSSYFQAIRTLQPYTDDKGYEIVSVFPLGRWKSLQEAIKETREGKIVDYVTPQGADILHRTNALLFAGLGTPLVGQESSAQMLAEFKKLTDTVTQNTSFELDFTSPTQPADESQILKTEQPNNLPGSDLSLIVLTEGEIQDKVNAFISGTPQPLPSTKQELLIAQQNQSNTDFDTVLEDFKSVVGK